MTKPGDLPPDSVGIPTTGLRPRRNPSSGSAIALGCVIGLLGLLMSLLVSRWLGDVEHRRQADDQIHDVTRIATALKSRMDDYEVFVRTVAGLFAASERVSSSEWDRFMSTANAKVLAGRGAMGVVFAPRVTASDDAVQAARARRQRPATVGERASTVIFPIEYIAPHDSRLTHLLGQDLLAGSAERDAVRHALAVAEPMLSAPIRFGGEASNSLGALIVMPVMGRVDTGVATFGPFDDVEAVVAVAVNYGEWVDAVMGAWANVYAVEVADPAVGSGRALLAVPAGLAQVGPVHALTVAGRRLNLRFFDLNPYERPLVETTALVAGLILSTGLAWLTYFLLVGRRRAEFRATEMVAALADSERRFALAMSATSDGVWEWQPPQSDVFLSTHACEIVFGEAHQRRLPLRQLLAEFSRGERAVVLTAIRAHLKQRSPLDVEVTASGKAGVTRHFRIRGQAQWDVMGRVVRLAGAMSDVTELRRQEDILRRTQRFYARILEAFPLPVMIKSEDHRYQLCNQSACDFAGLSREALLNGSTNDLLPGQADVHYAMDDEVLASGACLSKEFHVHLRDGREGDMVISKQALDGPDGAPVVLVVISNVTTLRRAERALRASLFEFDGLFRHSPLGMAMISKHGVIRRVNEAFTRIVGESEANLTGRSYREITPDRFHALDREKTLDALRRGAVTPYERAFLRPDGSEVPVVLSGAVIQGSDEEPGIWTVVEDISERKAADAALARMHATNLSTLEAMPDTLIQFDAELNVVAVRVGERDVLIGAPEAVVGKPLQALLSPARYRALYPRFVEALSGQSVQIAEFSLRDNDGQRAYVEARIAPVSTGGVLAILRNVTERRMRDKALRESETRFRLMADAAPAVIWVADAQLKVSYVNRRWLQITGATLDQSCGIGWQSYVHPDDIATVLETLAHARKARTAFELECRCRQVDGTYVWLMMSGALRYTEQGEFVGYICSGSDVTEVRQASLEVRRHRDHLAELVAEQTASMLLAKEMAERANEAKSVFLANMSHELRSPMHAMLSYARLGEDKCHHLAPEKVADYFHRIRTSGERLMRLLNDLLDLSKLEARQMRLEYQRVRLLGVVSEVLGELEAMSSARGLAVECKEHGDGLWLNADRERIGQVVRNLMANAIKFSPVGGRISLDIECSMMRAGRREADQLNVRALRLVVSDQGPGVPAEELERVFDKFVQSSKTRTGAGGTGLGLTICREIVDAHGGRIHAENGSQGGARFVVELPIDHGPRRVDVVTEEQAT